MTAETYDFWKMLLTSPAIIALAGALATLAGVWFKSCHDTKENQRIWKRQEAARKEERAFDRKSKAYEDFCTCFETTSETGIRNFDRYLLPTLIRIMIYGPHKVRIWAHHTIKSLVESNNYNKGSVEYQTCMAKAKQHSDDLHTAMMEDIDHHFGIDPPRYEK